MEILGLYCPELRYISLVTHILYICPIILYKFREIFEMSDLSRKYRIFDEIRIFDENIEFSMKRQ